MFACARFYVIRTRGRAFSGMVQFDAVPFNVAPAQVTERAERWLRGHTNLKRLPDNAKVSAWYLPFWSFYGSQTAFAETISSSSSGRQRLTETIEESGVECKTGLLYHKLTVYS